MPLTVIGAGLGRTGTLSLKRAIEQLGFGPCFHGLDSSRLSVEKILRAVNHPPVDWDEVFNGYQAAVDVPTYWLYRELAERYPAARVILTVRDPNAWFDSMAALGHSLESVALTEESLALRKDLREKMLAGMFGGPIAQIAQSRDRDSRIAAYERHNAEVRRSIPQDRLLVFDVKQGWAPLCDFLSTPIPDTAFPRANARTELPLLLQHFYGDQYFDPPPLA